MLHLGARLIRHVLAAARLAAVHLQLTQHPRQSGIADPDALFFHQLLVDPLHPALAFLVEPLEKLAINLDLVLADAERHLSLLGNDRVHRVTADLEALGNSSDGRLLA